ncbi:Zn(II)2Cys6 transcription factor [Aspergillus lucknowensis]|uniref:Zn(2)-C6 fungal-type domain-containing protein n=1 Tax=Aspergillus lucknowensis TaxID=176173 RepID=A0ABR4L9J9_9EURO
MLRRTRRAPKACSWCHHRKVRCDASIRGCPCTRCRQDGRPECVLRGKLPRNFAGFANAQAATQDNTINQTNPHLERIRALAFEADGRELTRSLSSSLTSLPGHVSFANYHFLELRGLATLDREDLAFLASKGCLSVPEESVLDEFVRQYFLHIHPGSPVIDEAEFWRVYRNPAAGKKISLFVFQAILFAGSPYISTQTIRKCGFTDKRNARNTLYKRVKILYDLHAEDRPHPQAQGSVLLTLHTSANEPQICSLWLTRAIQNAMIIGCQPGPTEDINASLKKRLWWSIILRDRSLCLGLRRRPQVTSFDMGIVAELPDEEDFADEISTSPVYSPEIKRMMLKVLQEQCRLAVLLSEMITFVFASHGISAPSLTLEQFHEDLARIARTKSAMQRWEACSPLHQWTEGKAPEAVTLFTNFTYMYYQTARIDLAHYEALLLENHLMFCGENYITQLWSAGNTLRDAMSRLTSIMEYFGREGRAQNLPLSVCVFQTQYMHIANNNSLAYVAMPLVLTAIDLKLSPSASEMDRRRRRLDSLGEIVRHSSRVYDVTDFVTTGTNHILRLAYMTSQHLFLRFDPDSQPAQLPGSGSGSGQNQNQGSLGSGMELVAATSAHGRANTWHEAFLRYPRAYLLISTSVDYSLAVGRLPYDSALPELVRSIPPIGFGIRLPWTIDGPAGEVPRRRLIRDEVTAVGEAYVQTVPTPGGASAAGTEQTGHGVHTVADDAPVQALGEGTEYSAAAAAALMGSTEQVQQEINLDYLYIEPDSSSTQMLDQDDAEFERMQLQQLAQGFDPLISSWVQEYFGEEASPQHQSPSMEMDGLSFGS